MELSALGWDDFFAEAFRPFDDQGYMPARVFVEQKHHYRAYGAAGEITAQPSGRFRHTAGDRAAQPAVGDWVAVQSGGASDPHLIQAVLPRKTRIARKAPISGGRRLGQVGGRETIVGGATAEQVIAANVDAVFFVAGLDGNFNLRRIERFLTLAADSGAKPVIALNKVDLCADADALLDQVRPIAGAAPVHLTSATDRRGLDAIADYLSPGNTAAFIGSSGVGKSTLINALLGTDRQKTNAVSRAVGKGRHTTTYRELIIRPAGGLIIDTPGIREIQLWGDEGDLHRSFADIEALYAECRFGNCRHRGEPGCAVQAALASGRLDRDRYQSYLKQQSELQYLAAKKNHRKKRDNRHPRGKKG